MGKFYPQYHPRYYQWHLIPTNEPDFDVLYNSVEWGPVPLYEQDASHNRDREDRHTQFFRLFSSAHAQDDLDWEIFSEASSLWLKPTVTASHLPQLIWHKLRRSRRHAWLTETEVSTRLARLRI